jgi:hypothetical protein
MLHAAGLRVHKFFNGLLVTDVGLVRLFIDCESGC